MKKYMLIAVLAVFCLAAALFVIVPTWTQPSAGDYDPWIDVNDDGKVDMKDVGAVARAFGATGENITKAGLLYDSEWMDISGLAGQYFNVTHDLNSTNLIVDITGKSTIDGGPHQRYFGGADSVHGFQESYSAGTDAWGVAKTGDGGYILVGDSGDSHVGWDAWLAKVDVNGNLQWNKTPVGSGTEGAVSVIQTNDGGYALAGWTSSWGAGNLDAWLVKTDAAGNAQWNKTYGGSVFDLANCVIQTNDGGYAIAGQYDVGGFTRQAWLIKTDQNGNAQWNQTFGDLDGNSHHYAYTVVQTDDEGYALVGWHEELAPSSDSDLFMVKTDPDGIMEWNITYGGTGYDLTVHTIQTGDGGYAIVGETDSFGSGDGDLWFVKTDMAGNVLWNRTYGGANRDGGGAVVATGDGGYALTGYTSSFGAGGFDFWLIKTDANGNIQWNQTYGGAGDDYTAFSVLLTIDGGYAMAGNIGAIPGLVKTDAYGNVEGFYHGLAWTDSTADTITLYRGLNDVDWNYVRVKIWKIKE